MLQIKDVITNNNGQNEGKTAALLTRKMIIHKHQPAVLASCHEIKTMSEGILTPPCWLLSRVHKVSETWPSRSELVISVWVFWEWNINTGWQMQHGMDKRIRLIL